MRFRGARTGLRPQGLDALPGKSNYFIGKQSSNWRKNVPLYSKVRYEDLYPGIDLVYYGNQGQIEYDLIVGPGVSLRQIRMAFQGVKKVTVDSNGDLLLSTAAGDIRQGRPIAYQLVNNVRHEVAAGYHVEGNQVCFEVGAYSQKFPLMIDPSLIYSSFLGGTGSEQGLGIAIDSQGSAYLTGSTTSTDFPLASAQQSTKDALKDAFVVKLNPAGTALVYSTYLGGNGDETGTSIAVDSQGNAYVAGVTGSGNFPATPGGFQDTKDGSVDGFLAKLSPSGSAIVYATYVGGDNSDTVLGLAVDAGNRAYVVGRTDSTRFRTALFPTPRNGNPVNKSPDGGAHWSASASGLTASVVNCLTQDPSAVNTIYAGTNVGVFKTIDAGATWNLTSPGSSQSAPFSTNAVVVDPSNGNNIYAATTNGIFKSTNGGGAYSQKNSGLISLTVFALAVDPNAPSILYAGTQVGVFKSTNGGDTWVGMNNGTNSARVNKIVIDPTQNPATTIYLGMSNRGMLKTTNGGSLWTAINTGLANAGFTQVNALVMDPTNPSTLYAGGLGFGNVVFKTTNGGAAWNPSDTGLRFLFNGQPALPSVNTLAIDPVTATTVYAMTANGGIYKSIDGGANWNQFNTGFINTTATAIAIDRSNPANLYTGTTIGTDAFAARFNDSGGLDYLMNFGGDESDEARGVAVESDGSAYITGVTSSNNLPVTNAFQSTYGGSADALVGKLNNSGTGFNYLTYLGGSGTDQAQGIAVRAGSAYVVGTTSSNNFPLANALKGTLADFDTDVFVTKLSASGSSLDFSTYLGGENFDQGFGIAVDAGGNTYVTGSTSSFNFPTLSAPQPAISNGTDAFVTKLNPAGTAIAFSTYLGGIGTDQGFAIAVDSSGSAYVIGNTSSTDFPTASPLQAFRGGTDAFVTKLGAAPDIVLSMTGSPNPVPYGNNLTYTIGVSNIGEIPAQNVKLSDTLLSGTGVVSINTTRGSCSGNRFINCDFGTLDAGANTTVTLVVLPPAVATMVNAAVASTITPEATIANNTATLNTPVVFTDLMIKNTSALQLTEVGGVDTYIIAVTNKGPAPATTITITDNLPPEMTFVGCTSTNSGICGGSGNNRTVTLSSLAAGASFTATIAARINNTVAPGTVISNTASIQSAVPDINPNNDAQTAIITAKPSSGPVINGLIAFSSKDGSITSGETDIYICNPDGTGQRDISFEEALDDKEPAWSPDGARIAFTGSPMGIYVMNADGSNKIQLTNASIDQSTTWSPDGTRIAFGHTAAGAVFIMNSDGTNQKKLVNGGVPSWSPDGSRISFSNGFGIGIVYADGSGVRNIVLPRVPFPGFGWSPDSSKLVVGMSDNSTFGISIYTVNADGTGLTRIENTSGGGTACFSPDGTRIVFSRDSGGGAQDSGIFTINLDGTGLVKVSGNLSGGFSPNWQRQPPNFTPLSPTFSISGHESNSANGNPVSISVKATGTLSRTLGADTNGNYIIKDLPGGGNYTLTPTQGGASPASRTYNNLSANQTGADFSFTFVSPEVTGHIKDNNGNPMANVRVGIRNAFPETDVFTDSTGFFRFPNEFTRFGSVLIPFPDSTHIIDPVAITIQTLTNNDFIARLKTASISGTVTVGGVGKSGIIISTDQPQPLSTTTDANGNYSFAGIGQGVTLTVLVDPGTYPFTPKTQTIAVNGQKTGVNFDAPLNQFLISGQVAGPFSGPATAGVTMTLGGAASATTQTDSQGKFSFGPVPGNAAYTVAATRTGYSFTPPVAAIQNLSSNTQLGFTSFLNSMQFAGDSMNVTVGEADGKVSLTVVRSGLLTETVKVDYRTSDETARQRTDYTGISGTLTFSPQEQSKTIVIPINDDSYVEGDESFTVILSNPTGGLVGDIGTAVVTIQDDDTATPTVNLLDAGSFFARQHYLDFLSRIPDASGLTFWTEQITDCGIDKACLDVKRVNVSAAFYLSIEFQDTGYLVERIYKTAYGDANEISTFGGAHQVAVPIVRFNEFMPDTQAIGRGVIVGQTGWETALENNKQAFTAEFVQRSRFTTAFLNSMTPAQFVDTLNTNAGNPLSVSERNQLVTDLSTNAKTRAQILRAVAEDSDLKTAEFNRAFVLMQYFGYLRRNPNDPQDNDYTGYEFWLTKLNQFNGNFVNADMVKAFISSGEYRGRFGP